MDLIALPKMRDIFTNELHKIFYAKDAQPPSLNPLDRENIRLIDLASWEIPDATSNDRPNIIKEKK
jgi:hypothetical protein